MPNHYYLYAPNALGHWTLYDIQHSRKAAEHMAHWGGLHIYYIAPACMLIEHPNE